MPVSDNEHGIWGERNQRGWGLLRLHEEFATDPNIPCRADGEHNARTEWHVLKNES